MMIFGRNRAVRAGMLAVVGLGAALSPCLVAAQLIDCPALASGSSMYKVVLDELSDPPGVAAADSALQNLRHRLNFNLTTQLNEFTSDMSSLESSQPIELAVIMCKDRKPVDGSEFTAARAETLSDQRVVVELWGTLLENTTGGPTDEPHAYIGYVIPPVLHYRPQPNISGKHLIRYPKEGTDGSDVLNKLPEASAFALIGLGVKAQKARDYDVAVWAFSRSEGQILDAQRSGSTPGFDSLLSYVRLAACQTRERARNDPQYDGAIALTSAESCGGGP